MSDKEKLLKQVNIDTIFFFLSVIQSIISFYLITEKKKSIFNINRISNDDANTIYWYNRRLNLIICIYFLINAYISYIEAENEEEKEGDELLIIATTLSLLGALFYLPIGNSNLIIEE